MAGLVAWELSRQDYKRNIKKAKLHHDKTVSLFKKDLDGEDAVQLRASSETLLSSAESALAFTSKIEEGYGDKISELQVFKDNITFNVKYRDHVSSFEDRAFVKFERTLRDDLAPRTAAVLSSKQGVLSTLGTLASMEKNEDIDDDGAAFVQKYSWVKGAWQAAVKAAGLSWDYYEKVRAFKGESNESFHGAEPAKDALQMLQKTPIPDEVVKYKEALIALLQVLVGK